LPGAPSVAGWDVPARDYYLALFCQVIAMALIYWATLPPPFGRHREPCYINSSLA
jgi:hypothetical protein